MGLGVLGFTYEHEKCCRYYVLVDDVLILIIRCGFGYSFRHYFDVILVTPTVERNVIQETADDNNNDGNPS